MIVVCITLEKPAIAGFSISIIFAIKIALKYADIFIEF